MRDTIERQAAIDALEKDKAALDLIITRMSADNPQLDHYVTLRNQVVYDINTIEHVPPAQIEPFTDREKRIFLAAMAREKDVCKQVDDKYGDLDESDKSSLVRTCYEIIRKVKSALWR